VEFPCKRAFYCKARLPLALKFRATVWARVLRGISLFFGFSILVSALAAGALFWFGFDRLGSQELVSESVSQPTRGVLLVAVAIDLLVAALLIWLGQPPADDS